VVTLPPIRNNHTLGIRARRRHLIKVHASIKQPQNQQEAGDASENNAHYRSRRRSAIYGTIIGRNDLRLSL